MMTDDEAMKILHPDTTREALEEIRYYAGFNSRDAELEAINEACLAACAALNPMRKDRIRREAIQDCLREMKTVLEIKNITITDKVMTINTGSRIYSVGDTLGSDPKEFGKIINDILTTGTSERLSNVREVKRRGNT